MAHLTSIGAGVFSDLSFSTVSVTTTPTTYADWSAKFATEVALGSASTANSFRRIKNVREFPALGTPANIVNVPVYGQSISSQVQGQADAPTLEITLNYVASDWRDEANYLGELVGKSLQYYFRFALLNQDSAGSTPATKYASLAAGLGTVANSQWFWVGRIEALVINPQLTDAVTATLTLSTQTDFYGAFTAEAA
jgi:hypothetical protein